MVVIGGCRYLRKGCESQEVIADVVKKFETNVKEMVMVQEVVGARKDFMRWSRKRLFKLKWRSWSMRRTCGTR